MTPERWDRIVEVFSAAAERSSDDQQMYLQATCGQDAELRACVEELLRNDSLARTEDFLSEAPWVIDDVPVLVPDFEEYRDVEYLGHGGMGVVYKAFDANLDTHVALKTILPRRLVTAEDVERFRTEPKSMAKLRHPHIVQVYKVGERNGQPYFTMNLIKRAREGASLGDHLPRFQEDPAAAARLMVKVARAVHHAHKRGILHRDLKPANILLDEEDNPHISDFGLAKHIGGDAELIATDAPLDAASVVHRGVVGTVRYMAPEQADPRSGQEVTTLSDVYGLGATLYTLLTGRAPVQAETLQATLQLLRDGQARPRPPRELNERVDRTLGAICLKCLNKNPEERYQSAEGLARELERWLRHQRTTVHQPLRVRSRNWCRRHPGAATLAAASTLLLLLSAAMAQLASGHLTERLRETARQNITIGAQVVADDFRWRLREMSSHVLEAAADQDVQALLRRSADLDSPEAVRRFMTSEEGRELEENARRIFEESNRRLKRDGIPEFATMFLLNKDGRDIAHAAVSQGDPRRIIGHKFERRDYFVTAKEYAQKGRRGLEAVHVSRVFRSHFDGFFKFAISVPVVDEDGSFLGAVEASISMHDTLGLDRPGPHPAMEKVALVGRVDPHAPTEESADRQPATELDHVFQFLVHERFEGKEARKRKVGFTPGPSLRRVALSRPSAVGGRMELGPWEGGSIEPDENYSDPLFAGRWFAGFAPVGNTELIVIVQQRYDDVIGDPALLAGQFVWWGWGTLATVVILAGAINWYRRRQ